MIMIWVELLRDAVKHFEPSFDHLQIHMNAIDAPAQSLPDIQDALVSFPAKYHTDQLQQGHDVHVLVELEPGRYQRPGQSLEITSHECPHHLTELVDERERQAHGEAVIEQYQPRSR